MAQAFQLTAQLVLRGPDTTTATRTLRQAFSNIKFPIRFDKVKYTQDIGHLKDKLNSRLGNFTIKAKIAPVDVETQKGKIKRHLGKHTIHLRFEPTEYGKRITTVKNKLRERLGSWVVPLKFTIPKSSGQRIAQVNTNLEALSRIAEKATASVSKLSVALKTLGVTNVQTSTTNVNNFAKAQSKVATQTKKVATTTKAARDEVAEFGRVSGLALRRFAGFTAGTTVVFGFIRAVSEGIKSGVDFERQMIRIAQVQGAVVGSLGSMEKEIFKLSTSLGVANEELVEVARTLSQTGLSAKDTSLALAAIAKTDLTPTFTNINKTTEGSIAIMSQFGIAAKDLEKALGSVNAVASKFAVESDDIMGAVRRAGGVFAAASDEITDMNGKLISGLEKFQQFIALFTSVRATTRETAETIATGLRTISARLQRRSTYNMLESLGVDLRDTQGRFVGIYEAITRLGNALNKMSPRDPRFFDIGEQLGGFRQINKTLPLILQAQKRAESFKVAQEGVDSINKDVDKSLQGLGRQFKQVREEFKSLMYEFTRTETFKFLAQSILEVTRQLITLARLLRDILPILTTFGAFKLLGPGKRYLSGFGKLGLLGHGKMEGGIANLPPGKVTQGVRSRDSVIAVARDEFVVRSSAVNKQTLPLLEAINQGRIDFAKEGTDVASGSGGYYRDKKGRAKKRREQYVDRKMHQYDEHLPKTRKELYERQKAAQRKKMSEQQAAWAEHELDPQTKKQQEAEAHREHRKFKARQAYQARQAGIQETRDLARRSGARNVMADIDADIQAEKAAKLTRRAGLARPRPGETRQRAVDKAAASSFGTVPNPDISYGPRATHTGEVTTLEPSRRRSVNPQTGLAKSRASRISDPQARVARQMAIQDRYQRIYGRSFIPGSRSMGRGLPMRHSMANMIGGAWGGIKGAYRGTKSAYNKINSKTYGMAGMGIGAGLTIAGSSLSQSAKTPISAGIGGAMSGAGMGAMLGMGLPGIAAGALLGGLSGAARKSIEQQTVKAMEALEESTKDLEKAFKELERTGNEEGVRRAFGKSNVAMGLVAEARQAERAGMVGYWTQGLLGKIPNAGLTNPAGRRKETLLNRGLEYVPLGRETKDNLMPMLNLIGGFMPHHLLEMESGTIQYGGQEGLEAIMSSDAGTFKTALLAIGDQLWPDSQWAKDLWPDTDWRGNLVTSIQQIRSKKIKQYQQEIAPVAERASQFFSDKLAEAWMPSDIEKIVRMEQRGDKSGIKDFKRAKFQKMLSQSPALQAAGLSYIIANAENETVAQRGMQLQANIADATTDEEKNRAKQQAKEFVMSKAAMLGYSDVLANQVVLTKKAQLAMESYNSKVAELSENFERMGAVVKEIPNITATRKARANALYSNLGGAVPIVAPTMTNVNPFANMQAFDPGAVQSEIMNLRNIFGDTPLLTQASQDVAGLERLRTELPKRFRQEKEQGLLQGEATETELMKRLEDDYGLSGNLLEGARDLIRSMFENDTKKTLANLTIREMHEFTNKLVKELGGGEVESLAIFRDGMNEAVRQYVEYINKSTAASIQISRERSQLRGFAAEQRATRAGLFGRRLSLKGRMAGVNARLGPGPNNVSAITGEINRLRNRRQDIKREMDTNNPEEIQKLTDELGSVNQALALNSDKLKILSEDMTKLTFIQERIAEIQQRREAASATIQDIALMSPEQRMQTGRDLVAFRQFQAGGQMNDFNMQSIVRGFQFMQRSNLFSPERAAFEERRVNRALLGPDYPGGALGLAATKPGTTLEERRLEAQFEREQDVQLEAKKVILNLKEKDLKLAIDNSNVAIDIAQGVLQIGVKGGRLLGRAGGGSIPGSYRGGDTVPAMLTPGEFVVKREAAQKNMGLLRTINAQGFARGGVVRGDGNKGMTRTEMLAYRRRAYEERKIRLQEKYGTSQTQRMDRYRRRRQLALEEEQGAGRDFKNRRKTHHRIRSIALSAAKGQGVTDKDRSFISSLSQEQRQYGSGLFRQYRRNLKYVDPSVAVQERIRDIAAMAASGENIDKHKGFIGTLSDKKRQYGSQAFRFYQRRYIQRDRKPIQDRINQIAESAAYGRHISKKDRDFIQNLSKEQRQRGSNKFKERRYAHIDSIAKNIANDKNIADNDKRFVDSLNRKQRLFYNYRVGVHKHKKNIDDSARNREEIHRSFRSGRVSPLRASSLPVQKFARGGKVDSVPAMLTPGEFVINRDAAKENAGLLQAINGKKFANGGPVGPSGGSGKTGNLGPAIQKFNESANKLVNAFDNLNNFERTMLALANSLDNLNSINIPNSIELKGRHDVNVVINGAQILENSKEIFQDLITSEVNKALRKHINIVTGETSGGFETL